MGQPVATSGACQKSFSYLEIKWISYYKLDLNFALILRFRSFLISNHYRILKKHRRTFCIVVYFFLAVNFMDGVQCKHMPLGIYQEVYLQ